MNYTQLIKAIDLASQQLLGRAAVAVNQALVVRNWLIGAYIVEFEQHGQDRARYGARLLDRLAADLEKRRMKGLNDPRVLRACRGLCRCYPQIRDTFTRIRGRFSCWAGCSEALDDSHPKSGCRFNSRDAVRRIPCPLSPELVLQFSWSKLDLNYYKERIRGEGDNPPIGIILCSDKDQTKVEFATAGLDNKLFVSRYLVALPSAQRLAHFVERDRAAIEASASPVGRSGSRPTKRRGRNAHISNK